MKIGIYGGTFNPIHLGHMSAAKGVFDALKLDKMLLIPDHRPPHKEMPEGSPTDEQRLAMVEIAADRLGKGFSACDIELKREGRSYTAHTLEELKKRYPRDELYLLMGTDMFLTLHQWYRPDTICSLANIAAFHREAGNEDAFKQQKKRLKKEFGASVKIITLPEITEVSSSQLREELLSGERPQLLDESIYGYILLNGLYGVRKDLTALSLSDLRCASYSMVKAKRLPHIRGTEEECALLAQKWGADETDARKAAILHDCTKFWNLERQLQFCEECDILLDQVERENLPLLHSKTGAGVAGRIFGMSEEICSAIFWHTTGKADMTLLEKILYIGDYAEPSRKYDWCEELRRLVLEDLDKGVLLGLNITIDHTRKKDNTIHYRTLEARDWLIRNAECGMRN